MLCWAHNIVFEPAWRNVTSHLFQNVGSTALFGLPCLNFPGVFMCRLVCAKNLHGPSCYTCMEHFLARYLFVLNFTFVYVLAKPYKLVICSEHLVFFQNAVGYCRNFLVSCLGSKSSGTSKHFALYTSGLTLSGKCPM